MAHEAYAFTEGLTFLLPPGALASESLTDETTSAAQVWATSLELSQIGTVYWGLAA